MRIYGGGPKVPPYKLHKSGLGPWGPDHFSLSPLKKRVSVVKETAFAAKVISEYEMYQTKAQTQICIFEARIYSFLFPHFMKSLRKCPKSLENKAFCAISCKIVISDKW